MVALRELDLPAHPTDGTLREQAAIRGHEHLTVGAAAAFAHSHVRDKLTIDATFVARLAADMQRHGVGRGADILVAARLVTFKPGFTFDTSGYRLTLLADRLEMGGGAISADGLNGRPGATGKKGANGSIGTQPGREGGMGGAGGPGDDASDVTVLCRTIVDARITAQGGAGGVGGTGGRGGNGAPGTGPKEKKGGPGGNGGIGGAGGNGGAGGSILLAYVDKAGPDGYRPTLVATGGPGGDCGIGGAGGFGGAGAPDGVTGGPGETAGQDGSDARPALQQLNEANFWALARSCAGAGAAVWARYRLRMADFFFRSFRSRDPAHVGDLALALEEACAAAALDPTDPRGEQIRNQLLTNQVPLGLPRDDDVVPDFRRYEQVVVDYAPMILSLFGTSVDILLLDRSLVDKVQDLDREIEHLRGSAQALRLDVQGAKAAEAAAQRELATVDERMATTNSALKKREKELREKRASLEGTITTLWDLSLLIVSIGQAGIAIGAMPNLVKDARAALRDPNNKSIFDWEGGKKPREDVQKYLGGLKDAYTKSKDVFSRTMMLSDIFSSDADAQSKELLKELTELAYERVRATGRCETATWARRAAEARLQLAESDLARANVHRDTLLNHVANGTTPTLPFLGEVASTLVRRAQAYLDVLMKFIFWSIRALEITTFSDLSEELAFDYGHIHPDTETEGYAALERAEPRPLEELLAAYSESWSRLPGIVVLRDRYESHQSEGLTAHDMVFAKVTDPAVLHQFREAGEIHVDVGLTDLPPGRYEATIAAMHILLIGARAASPVITCLVEHGGQCTARRVDGTTAELDLPPRRTPVFAVTTWARAGSAMLDEQADQCLRGRGVAASYRVSLEPHQRAHNQIDLSHLSQLQLGIAYSCRLT